jgi:hypothetical protein
MYHWRYSYSLHLYGDVITSEGLQNLDLCLALKAFEQGGIFIKSHLLWHGPRFFQSHSKDCPIPVFFLPIGTGTGTHSIGKNSVKIEQIGNIRGVVRMKKGGGHEPKCFSP